MKVSGYFYSLRLKKENRNYRFRFFLVFSVIFCAISFLLYRSVSGQSLEDARSKAWNLYNDFKRTVTDPGKLSSWWIQPLTGNGSLRTLDNTEHRGNYTLLCRGGRRFLEITAVPGGTGDLTVYVKWSPDEQGNLRKMLTLQNVSAPCGNGYISCTSPNSLGNCTFWLIGYNPARDEFFATNRTIERVPANNGTVVNPQRQDMDRAFVNGTVEVPVNVSYAHMASPCVCVKNVCASGGNPFVRTPEPILNLIGSAFVSALMKEIPDFIVTSTEIKKEEFKITYYGQSQRECDQAGVYNGTMAKNLSSYLDNSAALESDAASLYSSLSLDDRSPVRSLKVRVEELAKNNTYEYASCNVKVVVPIKTYAVSDLRATYESPGYCNPTDAVFSSCSNDKENKCFTVKVKVAQPERGGRANSKVTFRLFPDFISIIDKVTISWLSQKDGANTLFDDDAIVDLIGYGNIKWGTKDSLTDGTVDITSFFIKLVENSSPDQVVLNFVSYDRDDGRVARSCVDLTFTFLTKEPLHGCYLAGDIYVENRCITYENNPDCELVDEYYVSRLNPSLKIPLLLNGVRTDFTVLPERVEFCPDLIIERDDWGFERTYRCKINQENTYDYMKRYETVRGSVEFHASDGTLTFTDIRKYSNSTEWVTYPNQIMKVIKGEEHDTCIPVCKVKRPHKTREVEQSMEARGYDRTREFEFSFRQCIMNSSGNYTCPYFPDKEEQIITDCTCDDTGFKEAIWTLQALRSAANDIFCQKKKE